MIITLKGQLQALADQSQIDTQLVSGESLRALIQRVAINISDEARKLILDDSGDVRASLFVALDGEHIRDLDQPAGGSELLLMPPMAGG